jgi:hypothetical protein
MSIKKHLMIDYARRKHVTGPREWEVNREAVSDLCVCFGYPAISRTQPKDTDGRANLPAVQPVR